MQNLVVVSHTVCTHVGGPKNFGGAGTPPPWEKGLAVPLRNTNTLLPHVTTSNSFALAQTVWVSKRVENFWACWDTAPLQCGRG